MREMIAARSLVQSIQDEASRQPRLRVRRAGWRLGEWEIDRDMLKKCFDSLIQGTDLDGMELEFEGSGAADGKRGEPSLSFLEYQDYDESQTYQKLRESNE